MGKDNKKRRDYGDGSLYHRESDNRWVGSFYHNGERKYVYGSVGGKKEEARQKLREAQRSAEAGTLVTTNRQKVADYLKYWLSVRKLPLKPGTFVSQTTSVEAHLLPKLGHIGLQLLSRQHVQRFINALVEEDLEPSTIHKIYKHLHTAMKNAVEWQLLGANPCTHIVLPRIEERDYMVLDAEQAQTLLTALKGHPLEGLITLALSTGMRRGELLGLKWSDIDFERGRLRVQRSLIYINKQGYLETTPKTKGSKRTITLTRSALEVLKAHRTRQLQARVHAPAWNNLDLVFSNTTGGYQSFAVLARRFSHVLEQAGLPPMRFHDLRHTCATLLLAGGASPKVVQELLGHASIKITMDRYGHVLPGMQESVMAHYDLLLTGKSGARQEAN